MSTEKCRVEGNKIVTRCGLLLRSLEYGNPTPRSKGLFIPMRVNTETGDPGTDLAQLHSGAFVGGGVVLNFCPFCGESLNTWEETL
ncbi:hypothetical protein M942_22805 [Enterobacter ludwigii]|jgi:hypothetical protein|uniref:hypothetical protein n=1 Tax=Enterobacter ludwigii TaxID=299767 RepID=UPI0003D9347C|nr:hypothetical protein [Enterobacter ludwigii]AHE73442.1 hypothetical protein M942_22805 [Enterobacter ludwigii]